MPDPAGLVPAAFAGLRPADRGGLVITPVLETVRGESAESARAAAEMVRRGVAVIVTLGGDGTNRMVAPEAGSVPIMPLSTGTNNTFPLWVEPTIAGLAAGMVALRGPGAGCRREKLLRVTVGAPANFPCRRKYVGQHRDVWDRRNLFTMEQGARTRRTPRSPRFAASSFI